jgi:hypothetical protein
MIGEYGDLGVIGALIVVIISLAWVIREMRRNKRNGPK